MDYIEGLSPAISIEQKTTHRNPRSTVGTVTPQNKLIVKGPSTRLRVNSEHNLKNIDVEIPRDKPVGHVDRILSLKIIAESYNL